MNSAKFFAVYHPLPARLQSHVPASARLRHPYVHVINRISFQFLLVPVVSCQDR